MGDEGLGRAKLRIRLLGAPRLQLVDAAEHSLGRRDAALLTMLALQAPMPRARVAALLWPDADDEQARNNLRQLLFRLRRTARRDVVLGDAMLHLASDIAVDLIEFQQQVAGDVDAGAGDLLGDYDYSDVDTLDQWSRTARAHWHTSRLDMLAQAASDLESQGQLASALSFTQRMLAEDPLLEHAHRRLMRLHYLRGDRAAALSAYERCRKTLQAELGASPSGETERLAELIASSGALPHATPHPRHQPTPVSILRPPRLIGRDSEWREIERSCANGTAVLILGEPGIGKTRLLMDFASAQDDAPVAGARPGDSHLPYALLARVLRVFVTRIGTPSSDWIRIELARIVPELGGAPIGKLDRLRLQQATNEALNEWSSKGLALIGIDDLQFADAATLELLPSLVASPRKHRVAWVLCARSNEMPPSLAAWTDDEGHGSLHRISLRPLDLPAVEAMLTSMAIPGLQPTQWAESLMRHTGGNPMFILETLLALIGHDVTALARAPLTLPAPTQVGILIERRLTKLSPEALKLARLAAIAGPDFSVEIAASILRRHTLDIADTWHELEAAQVIRDQAFAHDLIYEATLKSIPAAIARSLHGEVAKLLETRNAPSARVARHWFEAQVWARAGDVFVAAAREAYVASRRVEECELWHRAIDSYQRADDLAKAFEARCNSVHSILATRPLAEALATTERLLADAVTEEQRLGALSMRSTALLLGAWGEDGRKTALEAHALARQLGSSAAEFDTARTLALALAQIQQAEQAVEVLRPYQAAVDAQGDPAQRYGYWSDFAYVVQYAGGRREAADAYATAIALAEQLGDLHEAAVCISNLAGLLGQLGKPADAQAQAEKAHRLRARLGDTEGPAAGAVDMNLAVLDAALGRYDRALLLFDDARRKFGSTDTSPWPSVCENHLANTWLQLGQPGRAQQMLRPLPDVTMPSTQVRRAVIQTRIDRALNRRQSPLLSDALSLLGSSVDPPTRMLAQLDVARMEKSAAMCEQVRQTAESMELFGIAMKARLLQIEAHSCTDAKDEASARAVEVLPMMSHCQPADTYWPEAQWIVVHALKAAGALQAADDVLDQAANWIEHVALPQIPAPLQDSFLKRNPVNSAVLAAAKHRLQT